MTLLSYLVQLPLTEIRWIKLTEAAVSQVPGLVAPRAAYFRPRRDQLLHGQPLPAY